MDRNVPRSRSSVLLVLAVLGACVLLGIAVLAARGYVSWGEPATPTPSLQSQQQITIEAPQLGASVASPATLRGSTTQFPFDGNLIYRVFDAQSAQIGTAPFPVNGSPGKATTFEVQAAFSAAVGGPGRIEVVDINQDDGSVRGIAAI